MNGKALEGAAVISFLCSDVMVQELLIMPPEFSYPSFISPLLASTTGIFSLY